MRSLGTNEQSVSGGENASQPIELFPSATLIREELEKVISSPAFHGSARLRGFIRYAVEETLEGRGSFIKEYSVATPVFGREPSFDPRLDNIVRTEARRLRSRLAAYYEAEGAGDTLRIEFPKGSYAPHFHVVDTGEADSAVTFSATDGLSTSPQSVPVADTGVHRLQSTPEVAFWRRNPSFSIRRLLLLAAVAGLLIASGAWLVRFGRHSISKPVNDSASIAVLPFVNLGTDADSDFFSDGLTDELIDTLGQVPGLHVVGRTSSFQFKGKTSDLRKIGSDLNVRTVLEGTVRKYGNRLRITAEMDETASGYRVWSESYDRDLKDALAIQREISQSITRALGVQLAKTGAGGAPAGTGTVSPEAHQAYLKGRFFWNKLTAESVKTAMGFFEQALAIDPNYASAYVGLAHCYAQIPHLSTTPSAEVIPKIRAAASKALELDSSLGEAHLELARAFQYDYDWAASEQEFETGVSLNPGDAFAHRVYAVELTLTGRLEDALRENTTAQDLDPVSPYMAQGIGRSLYFLHRYKEAIEQYRKAMTLDSNFTMVRQGLGTALVKDDAFIEGLAEIRAVRSSSDSSGTASLLGWAYAVTGKTAEARKILSELEKPLNGRPRAFDVARIYIGLGDSDRAFEWLAKSVDAHDVNLFLKADPLFDSLRSDPRFSELLKRSKLI